jgi:hypothetical protein
MFVIARELDALALIVGDPGQYALGFLVLPVGLAIPVPIANADLEMPREVLGTSGGMAEVADHVPLLVSAAALA